MAALVAYAFTHLLATAGSSHRWCQFGAALLTWLLFRLTDPGLARIRCGLDAGMALTVAVGCIGFEPSRCGLTGAVRSIEPTRLSSYFTLHLHA